MSKAIKIAHLYPDYLNLYGDMGNIMAFKKRLEWRNIPFSIEDISIREHEKKFSDFDLFFIGGGQDNQQDLVAKDFLHRKNEMKAAVENGAVILAVCGGYQLLGKSFETSDSRLIKGLEILGVETRAVKKSEEKRQDRLVGNISGELVCTMLSNPKIKTLVGFENHSGRTYIIDENTKPLIKVKKGFGNNATDSFEGAVYKNVFGTYLHGSLLPKNPHLVDELLYRALQHAGLDEEYKLEKLDDNLEIDAHNFALNLN